MTKAEFAKGWKLLILQPWGWRYRTVTAEGKPTEESQSQLDFYYDKLKWATAEAWWNVVENIYAQGEAWPSLREINHSLQSVNARFVKALPKPEVTGSAMPEEVRTQLSKLGVFGAITR